jgi:hypothetical protein
MEPVPSYEDLTWLFEAEPTYRYTDDERQAGYSFDWRELWPYTAVNFRTTRAEVEIEMYIEPRYQSVRLQLRTASGAELVDLELRDARSVGVERIKDRELLRVDFPTDSPRCHVVAAYEARRHASPVARSNALKVAHQMRACSHV